MLPQLFLPLREDPFFLSEKYTRHFYCRHLLQQPIESRVFKDSARFLKGEILLTVEASVGSKRGAFILTSTDFSDRVYCSC